MPSKTHNDSSRHLLLSGRKADELKQIMRGHGKEADLTLHI